MYGRYHEPEHHTDRIVLQYWFFYPFNDWDNGTDVDSNDHEGDWEMIQVILNRATKQHLDGTESTLFTSQHISGSSYEWNQIDTFQGTHPRVYVAKGSHGCWHSAGEFPVIKKLQGNIKKRFKNLVPRDLASGGGKVSRAV